MSIHSCFTATQETQLHIPVMWKEIIEVMQPLKGCYLDATAGMGGHAKKILSCSGETQVCAIDRDAEALEIAKKNLAEFSGRVHFFQLPFSRFEEALAELDWKEIQGAIADLGVSSMQLDRQDRGFSFRLDGPLDMRMDKTHGHLTAAEIVNRASFDELKNLLTFYGEEPQAGRIARHIVDYRQAKKIESTLELAGIIEKAYPPAWRKNARNNPATRSFQALRIHINDELSELKKFLGRILNFLKINGRLAVISFHSLEDRIVKNAMRGWSRECVCPPQAQKCQCNHTPEVKILFKKPLIATPEEISMNPRARSAKLRAIEKIADCK